MKSLFIYGYGDIGKRVAELATAQHIAVQGFSRGIKNPFAVGNPAIEHSSCDLDSSETIPVPDLSAAAVLYAAPPPGGGVIDTRVRNFISALEKGSKPAKVLYLSTTSVYGECGTAMVSEDNPVNPTNHTAKRRCDAERRFRKWGAEKGVAVVILRVAGIYGPGRIPLQRILTREPLLNEMAAGYSNRIHADDLATICMAALKTGEDGDIFNVCDGEISKLTDYFNAITALLELPRLPQVSLEEARQVMSPLMFTYMTESRQISNRKMLEKLGVTLKYPTMADGLKASIDVK